MSLADGQRRELERHMRAGLRVLDAERSPITFHMVLDGSVRYDTSAL
jgi:hypothetical protein